MRDSISIKVLKVFFMTCVFSAQAVPININIDFGQLNQPAPSSTFGGAAEQPGFWNRVSTTGTTNLFTANGRLAGRLMLSADNTAGLSGSFGTDVQNLVNDNFFSTVSSGWAIDLLGLKNGLYDIVYYAPSNILVSTGSFAVNGIVATEIVNNDFDTTTLVDGITHGNINHIRITDHIMRFTSGASAINSNTGLSGLQLTHVPEPTPLGLLLGAGLFGLMMKRLKHLICRG